GHEFSRKTKRNSSFFVNFVDKKVNSDKVYCRNDETLKPLSRTLTSNSSLPRKYQTGQEYVSGCLEHRRYFKILAKPACWRRFCSFK
ncbi:MAG: hypothetical protein JW730_11320, partial [Anaerolineales bacterium]|nr:hypothetical protein [Anaerolineales bacterium]